MKDDPVVAEIRRYRMEHAEKYEHDLKKIQEALVNFESKSGREVVHRKPRLLSQKKRAANQTIHRTRQRRAPVMVSVKR